MIGLISDENLINFLKKGIYQKGKENEIMH